MRRFYNTVVHPAIRPIAARLGWYRRNTHNIDTVPDDLNLDDTTVRIFYAVNKFTMTSPERISALVDSLRFVVEKEIEGAIVECGVWRGGSMMVAALMLKELGDENRDIYLYDTFTGMTAPTEEDIEYTGVPAGPKFEKKRTGENSARWCVSPLEETRRNVLSTGYPSNKIHFIKGTVEDTLPAHNPSGAIALLRLDTDWYVSTKHELTHLFPLLAENGPLIVDDYGHWQGAKQAVDEYISEHNLRMPLKQIDDTGVIGFKPSVA